MKLKELHVKMRGGKSSVYLFLLYYMAKLSTVNASHMGNGGCEDQYDHLYWSDT